MPKEMINGSSVDSLVLNKIQKPKKVVSSFHQNFASSNTAKQKNTGLFLRSDNNPSLIKSSEGLFILENGNEVDLSNGTPLVLRKDRLVQEIENSLAEIEDHYSSTSKLEEERSAVEMERNTLLKDIEEDGSGGKANEIPPLDVSEIIRSFEDLPVESDSGTAGDSSLFDTGGDTSTMGDSSEGGNDIQMASSIQDRSSLQDEHSYANSRRQSPRRTPASSKPASGRSTPDVSDSEYGLRKTSSPSKSGIFITKLYQSES